MSRYLITTADESTWKFDRPVLFLGKWCIHDSRHHIWSKLDYSVLDPSPINDSLSEYFQLTQGLFDLLLDDLSNALNDLHHCSHTNRYWSIIIGPWLRSFCNIIMFRWIYLASAHSTTDIDGSSLPIEQEIVDRYPRNYSEYRKCTTSDCWSQYIYSKIWNSNKFGSITDDRNETQPITQRLTTPSTLLASRLQNTTSRQIVVVDSYLPKILEVALKLLVGSTRLRIPRIDAPLTERDPATRGSLTFKRPAIGRLHELSRDLVIDQIPSAYVEGYRSLIESTTKLNLPSSPKVIFTSNRHLYDDVFNAWAARATEHGSSYIIGQHGGYYGSSLFCSDPEIHEEQISDLQLTWGWRYSNKQIGGPCLTKVGQKYRSHKQARHLLIVCDNMWTNPRSLFYDIPEHSGYLEHVAKCVQGLPPEVSADVLIRLNHAHAQTGSSQVEWWGSCAPTINVDDGLADLKSLVRKSRLVVTTYNGTTFLETLNLNVPTLITWNSAYVQLRPEAIPYFQRLEEVGIFHSSDRSFADHVARHWGDIESWWASDDVQSARLTFCEQFSRIQPHPLLYLRRVLNSVNWS